MPLTVGERLDPYEILAPVGVGGMDEVYKARGTRLDRTVQTVFSADAKRLYGIRVALRRSSSPRMPEGFDRPGSTDSHEKFVQKYELPFPLLSDESGRVRKLYGVKSTLGVIPGRATFVIDRDGIVRRVFASQFAPLRHIDEALAALSAAAS